MGAWKTIAKIDATPKNENTGNRVIENQFIPHGYFCHPLFRRYPLGFYIAPPMPLREGDQFGRRLY